MIGFLFVDDVEPHTHLLGKDRPHLGRSGCWYFRTENAGGYLFYLLLDHECKRLARFHFLQHCRHDGQLSTFDLSNEDARLYFFVASIRKTLRFGYVQCPLGRTSSVSIRITKITIHNFSVVIILVGRM